MISERAGFLPWHECSPEVKAAARRVVPNCTFTLWFWRFDRRGCIDAIPVPENKVKIV